MNSTNRIRVLGVALLTAAALAASPIAANAQRRAVARGPVGVRSSFVFVGGFGFPHYVLYDPFFYNDAWGYPPYGPAYGPYGYYGYGVRDELTSSVRLEVKPRQAQVFVDGYTAGVVDDYDGIFQRLRLRPGSHEIVLYMPGYRTVRQSVYLNPEGDQRIKFDMEKLPAGQISEPPPTPPAAPAGADLTPYGPPNRLPPGLRAGRPMPMGPGGGPGPMGMGPGPGGPPPQPPDGGPDGQPPASASPSANPQDQMPAASFGTLSIRVQPDGAEILIDGQPWPAESSQNRLQIQIVEGRHHIEVRKDGFTTFSEDVLIRANATVPLNVSLAAARNGA